MCSVVPAVHTKYFSTAELWSAGLVKTDKSNVGLLTSEVHSSEMLVNFYQTTQYHIPDNNILQFLSVLVAFFLPASSHTLCLP
jgi:hypothetical protein